MIECFKKCFSINLNDYDNIAINLEINKLLLPAFIVFGVLMVFLAIYRSTMKDMIFQLTRHGACSEENACTLEELGLSKSFMLPYLIKNDTLLSKVVGRAGRTEYSYEEYKSLSKEEKKKFEKIDFAVERFYIREEQADRARHINEKYGTNKKRILVGCIFLTMFYIALSAAMPEILNVINNLLK